MVRKSLSFIALALVALICACSFNEAKVDEARERSKHDFRMIVRNLNESASNLLNDYARLFPQSYDKPQEVTLKMVIERLSRYVNTEVNRADNSDNPEEALKAVIPVGDKVLYPLLRALEMINSEYPEEVSRARSIVNRLSGHTYQIVLALQTTDLLKTQSLEDYFGVKSDEEHFPQSAISAEANKLNKFVEFTQTLEGFNVFETTNEEIKEALGEFVIRESKISTDNNHLFENTRREAAIKITNECNAVKEKKFQEAFSLAGVDFRFDPSIKANRLRWAKTCDLISTTSWKVESNQEH